MTRLFVAVRPPAAVLDVLAALPRPPEQGVRWVPPEQWHITLRFLGEAEPDQVIARIDPVERLPRAQVELGPRVSRLGRSVICVPASGLDQLAAFVEGVTAAIGQPSGSRPFHGHLTLARLRHRGACGLAGHRVDAVFEAREVELVESTLSNRGARHEVIRRWTLAPRSEPVG